MVKPYNITLTPDTTADDGVWWHWRVVYRNGNGHLTVGFGIEQTKYEARSEAKDAAHAHWTVESRKPKPEQFEYHPGED